MSFHTFRAYTLMCVYLLPKQRTDSQLLRCGNKHCFILCC